MGHLSRGPDLKVFVSKRWSALRVAAFCNLSLLSVALSTKLEMSPVKELPTVAGSVDVVLLDGGGFTTTDDTRIHADGHDKPYYLYDWCFYIHQKTTGRRILWDLGISSVSLQNVLRKRRL